MSGHYEYRSVYDAKLDGVTRKAFWVADPTPKPPAPAKPPAVVQPPKPKVSSALRAEAPDLAAQKAAMDAANRALDRGRSTALPDGRQRSVPYWTPPTWAQKVAADDAAAIQLGDLRSSQHGAYEALAQRNGMVSRMLADEAKQRALDESGVAKGGAVADAAAMAGANRGQDVYRLGAGRQVVGGTWDTQTWQQKLADDLVAKATATGDFISPLGALRDQQAASGGRYWNQDAYNALYDAMVKQSGEVASRLQGLIATADRFRAAGDRNSLVALVNSKDWTDSIANYVKWFGDGEGKTGIVDGVGGIMKDIADVNQNYLERTLAGQRSGGSGQSAPELLQTQIERLAWSDQYTTDENGNMVKVPLTMQEYLDKLAKRQRDQQMIEGAKAQTAQAQTQIDLAMQGYLVDPKTGRAWNPQVTAVVNTLKAGANGKDVEALIAVVQGNNPATGKQWEDGQDPNSSVTKDRALRELDGIFLSEWERQNPAPANPVGMGGHGYLPPANRKWLDDKYAARDLMWRLVTGGNAPSGFASDLNNALTMPVLGDFLKFSQVPLSGIGSIIRGLGAALGGEVKLPDIDLGALFKGDLRTVWAKLVQVGIDTSPEAKKRALEAIQEAERALQEYHTSGDWGKLLESYAQYGSSPTGSGLANIVLPAAWDPLSYMSIPGFARSARLAVERGGGLRSVLTHPGGVFKDLYKMQAWRGLPGERVGGALGLGDLAHFGRAQKLTAREFEDFKKVMGNAFKDVKDVPKAEWDRYFALVAQNGLGSPAVESFATRMLRGRSMDPSVLSNVAQGYLERVAKGKGVTLPSALAVHGLAKDLERRAVEAEVAQRAFRLGEARVGVVGEQTAYRGAVKAPGAVVYRGLGKRAATERASLAAAARANVDARRQLSETGRLEARKLVDTTLTNAERSDAFKRAKTVLAQLEKLDDRPNAVYGTIPGPVTRSVDALRDFDRAISYGERLTDRPSSVAVVKLTADGTLLDGQIAALKRSLVSAVGDPAKVAALRTQLRDLGAARRFVASELKVATGQRAVARETVQRFGGRVASTFKSSRVLVKVHDLRGAAEEQMRDLNVAYRGSVVKGEAVMPLSAAEKVRYSGLREKLAASELVFSGSLGSYKAELAGVDLEAALVAFSRVAESAPRSLWWKRVLGELAAQARGVLGGDFDLNDFLDLAQRADLSSYAGGMNLGDFRTLEGGVRKAIVAARGGAKRAGAISLAGGKRGVGQLSSVRRDVGLTENLAKFYALRDLGRGVWGYDEARTVLMGSELKRNTSAGVARAASRAARAGGTFDEHWAAQAADKVASEGRLALERYASSPRFDGWSSAEIWATFEAEHLGSDFVTDKVERTAFQVETLKRGVSEALGGVVDPDDASAMERALSGRLAPPKDARLAGVGEFGSVPFDLPVYVLPSAAHPRLSAGLRHSLGVTVRWAGVFVPEGATHETVMHEIGHVLQAVDENAALVKGIEGSLNRWVLADGIGPAKLAFRDVMGGVAGGAKEGLAETYMLWAGRDARLRTVSGYSWDDLMRVDPRRFGKIGVAFEKFVGPQGAAGKFKAMGVSGVNVPPFGNRAAMVDWLEKGGYWSRRSAEDVRAGRRVWSVADEREFWTARYGIEPDWVKESELKAILEDRVLYDRKFREWGYFDAIESASSTRRLVYHGNLRKAVALGGVGDIKRARTYTEIRDWFVQRYGDLVTDDGGKTLRAAPWLMAPDKPEYVDWLKQSGLKRMPAGMLQPGEETDAFLAALDKAMSARLHRLVKGGELRAGDAWMPEEQFLFALDVTNEMLVSKAWHHGGLLTRLRDYGLGGTALGLFGDVMRWNVAWNPAFPVMNWVDRFGVRPWMLALQNAEGHFTAPVSRKWVERISEVEALGEHAQGIWDLRGASGKQIFLDKTLQGSTRARGFVKMVREAPFALSSMGENTQKLWFARHMAQSIEEGLLADGLDPAVAEELALMRVRERVRHFFPTMEHAGEFERMLNEIIPFFSYNMRNNMLGVEMFVTHPWIWSMADRLRTEVIRQNVAAWNEEHPDEPWPSYWDPAKLIIHVGGMEYGVDFSQASDWFRGPNKLFGKNPPKTVADFLGVFVRVPHPQQAAFLTWLTSGGTGMTPWGARADVSQWFFPLEFWNDLNHIGTGDSTNIDMVQFASKWLFFTQFSKLDPVSAATQYWFSLRDAGKYDLADDYYNRHKGEIDVWLGLHTTNNGLSPLANNFKVYWKTLSAAEQQAYEDAHAGLAALKASFDSQLAQYMGTPWVPEARALRQERQAAIARFYLSHPDLLSAGDMLMTGDDWAKQLDDWAVDNNVDYYMGWDTTHVVPVATDFKDELSYLQALKDYNTEKETWLKAHPEVETRLTSEWSAVATAWHNQTEHWGELIDAQIEIRIAIATEETKGAGADRELIDALYGMADATGLELDAEAFAPLYGKVVDDPSLSGSIGSFFSTGRAKIATVMPGLRAYRYMGADAATRKKMDADSARIAATKAYVAAIGAIVKKAKSGKDFYDMLLANPALAREYWTRNPAKYQTYLAGQEYVKLISRWGQLASAGKWAEANAYFTSLPAWVKDRYYGAHPQSRQKAQGTSAYFGAMEQWSAKLYAKDYVGAKDFFARLPDWMKEKYFTKHPKARYTFELENGLFAAAEGFFLADDIGRADILSKNPRLAAFLAKFGGTEGARRGIITALYALIPAGNAWLKRKFRETYPEIFSDAAAGAATLSLAERRLKNHPELVPAYEKFLASQKSLYAGNLKHSKVAPRPMHADRVARVLDMKKARSARFDEHWMNHKRLRGG